MGMPHSTGFWTPDEVRALPADGRRYETITGELLVTPAPGVYHQRAVLKLLLWLHECLGGSRELEALASPADIELDESTLVQPDVFVTRRLSGSPPSWSDVRLHLAVEVLSPSTARYDRVTKRMRYQQDAVEYWVVDLDGRLVERWMPGDTRPEIITDRLAWKSCTMELPPFFDTVLK